MLSCSCHKLIQLLALFSYFPQCMTGFRCLCSSLVGAVLFLAFYILSRDQGFLPTYSGNLAIDRFDCYVDLVERCVLVRRWLVQSILLTVWAGNHIPRSWGQQTPNAAVDTGESEHFRLVVLSEDLQKTLLCDTAKWTGASCSNSAVSRTGKSSAFYGNLSHPT